MPNVLKNLVIEWQSTTLIFTLQILPISWQSFSYAQGEILY